MIIDWTKRNYFGETWIERFSGTIATVIVATYAQTFRAIANRLDFMAEAESLAFKVSAWRLSFMAEAKDLTFRAYQKALSFIAKRGS